MKTFFSILRASLYSLAFVVVFLITVILIDNSTNPASGFYDAPFLEKLIVWTILEGIGFTLVVLVHAICSHD